MKDTIKKEIERLQGLNKELECLASNAPTSESIAVGDCIRRNSESIMSWAREYVLVEADGIFAKGKS
jgi:hypothetical protein